MRETTKAQARRMTEDTNGKFQWRMIFTGKGCDIGPGDDPIRVPGVLLFDKEQGDCNVLDKYFAPDTFDFLHSSNCLEHVFNAHDALGRWIKVVKPGGHLVITIPESTLYGDMLWKKGPRYNDDHKSTFSVYHKGSPAPRHYHIPTWIPQVEKEFGVKCLLQRLVDTNYDYSVMFTRDQTFRFEDGVECFCEIVLLKSK